MPEFQRQKRRSLTDEQLYEEYHRADEPKKKGKSPQKKQKPPTAREVPPVSPQRKKMQEEQREEPPRVKKAASDKAPQKKKSPPQQKPETKAPARKRRGKMTLYYVLIGIVAVAAVSILSVTVLFNISSFQVTGDTAYSDEEIIAACGIDAGDNLLRINIGNAEEQIVSRLVYIDSAKISRGFPNRLLIAVEPAHPALSFMGSGSFYIISERGRLLEIGQISADCPVVKGFSPAKDSVIGSQLQDDSEGRISIALQMIGYMEQYGLHEHCEIDLSDTLNITLTYDNRIEMELGASPRLEDKFYYASLLLGDEIAPTERCTLILSNPDRVVKRPIYDTEPEVTEEPESDPEEEPPESGDDDPEITGENNNSDDFGE